MGGALAAVSAVVTYSGTAVAGLALYGVVVDAVGSFGLAGALLWLPVVPFVGLYARLPETRGTELDEWSERAISRPTR